tara:strand:- start:2524 stop:3741 length:1218 start_codon:yes stop_codon:yes gene_type:complete
MSDKFFCVAPFVHLYAHTTGEVKTCCVGNTTYGSLKEKTIEEIWHSDEYKKLRRDFIAGEITPELAKNCSTCINFENSNIHSLREGLNDEFKAFAEIDENADVNLLYMDFRFNNFCNFKCRGCYHEYSSSIHNEDKGSSQDLIFAGKTEEDLFDQVYPYLPDAQKIYFAGGEPLIQWEHWKILDRLEELNRTDMKLVYNTNFSTMKYKQRHITEYWKKFSDVKLLLSLDGMEKGAEYWRNGTKWNQLVKNIKKVKKETPHVYMGVTCTVGWANLYTAMDFIDYCADSANPNDVDDFEFLDPVRININVLEQPIHFSTQSVPDWKKEELEKRIRKTYDKYISMGFEDDSLLARNLVALIDFMWAKEGDSRRIKGGWDQIVTRRDELRGENFFEAFPEHINMKEIIE